MKVSSVNVNGIRAAARKGLVGWLAECTADVVCLQETRADGRQVDEALRDVPEWHCRHAAASTKGRNGVAVLSRVEPEAMRVGFECQEFQDAGRYLEVDLPRLTLASVYLPKGDVGTPRQDEKERFMAALLPYLAWRREKAAAEDRQVLVCGDLNIAHRERDLKNWKGNQRSSGFLPREREWFGRVLDEAGYTDVVRSLYPDREGPYTWWSYRGRAFDNDAGWRIDYQLAARELAATAVDAVVERAPSYDQRWSDHAPVTVAYQD